MPPRAPWEVDDDRINSLNHQLKQSQVECSALQEQIARKDDEVLLFRQAREDAETRARKEELRVRELEAIATKATNVSALLLYSQAVSKLTID